MPWEDPELDVDEDGLIAQILNGIRARIEGWEPNEGAPEVALGEEIGVAAAAINAFVAEGFRLTLAAIGETVFGIVPRTDAYAIADITLALRTKTFPPSTPPTIDIPISFPAGFTVVANGVTFQSTADFDEVVTFNRLMTSGGVVTSYIAAVTVETQATVPGTVGNVSAGEGSEVVAVTSHPYVFYTSMGSHASGGVDGESLTDYLDRLTDYLATLRPGGVRAADLATLARTVNGVQRAMAIDLYDPEEPGTHERTATVIAIDADGEPVGGSTAADLADQLELAREVNFRIILAEPTYTDLDITVTLEAVPGADLVAVEAAVEAAITAAIHPATWGSTAADPDSWSERTTLRTLDLAVVAAQVPDVTSAIVVTVNGDEHATTLTGPGALPSPVGPGGSSLVVTVS